MTSFGARLIAARHAREMTQSALARAADIAGDTMISRYERDEIEPRTDTIARLADTLAIPFEWLALGRGPTPNGVVLDEQPAPTPRAPAKVRPSARRTRAAAGGAR